MKLLPQEFLIKTSELDKAKWNYDPFLRYFQRARFRILLSLLRNARYNRLLEIGYGSGILLPELSRFCDELYGIDTHPANKEVQGVLKCFGIKANLVQASTEKTMFPAQYFDCCIAVSTLEYVTNIRAGCLEIRRILVPGGILALVTPGHSGLVDFGLQILTGKSPKAEY